ncbi:hypothetical protein BROUX41_003615 [Berkeleyomyces rouxiae]|uniref:uncharacterized protein n=1 Tax=Berkeleyomyces rouxiae TaxID=2035830 RepID=UPI003B7A642F
MKAVGVFSSLAIVASSASGLIAGNGTVTAGPTGTAVSGTGVASTGCSTLNSTLSVPNHGHHYKHETTSSVSQTVVPTFYSTSSAPTISSSTNCSSSVAATAYANTTSTESASTTTTASAFVGTGYTIPTGAALRRRSGSHFVNGTEPCLTSTPAFPLHNATASSVLPTGTVGTTTLLTVTRPHH